MKFVSHQGKIKEVVFDSNSNFEVTRVERLSGFGYVLPKLDKDSDLIQAIDHFMRVVACHPPYIDGSSIAWILSTLDELKDFCTRNPENPRDQIMVQNPLSYFADIGTRNYSHYEGDGKPPRPSFIELSRRFYCLHLMHAHIWGGKVHTSKRYDLERQDKHEFIQSMVFRTEDILNGRLQFPAFQERALEFLFAKQFKREMTRDFFKGSKAVFVVPKGEILTIDTHPQKTVLSEGTAVYCEVDRFYLSEGGESDVGLVGYPESLRAGINYDFHFYPIIRCILGCAEYSRFLTAVYVPLDWFCYLVVRSLNPLSSDHEIKKIDFRTNSPVQDSEFDNSVAEMVKGLMERDVSRVDSMLNNYYRNR